MEKRASQKALHSNGNATLTAVGNAQIQTKGVNFPIILEFETSPKGKAVSSILQAPTHPARMDLLSKIIALLPIPFGPCSLE